MPVHKDKPEEYLKFLVDTFLFCLFFCFVLRHMKLYASMDPLLPTMYYKGNFLYSTSLSFNKKFNNNGERKM